MPVKTLLLIGTSIPERLEDFYARSFRALGVEVTVFDPELPLRRVEESRVLSRLTLSVRHHVVHRELLAFYKQPRWDAVFVVKGQWLAAETIEQCRARARAVPWVVLNPDSPWAPNRGATSRHIIESIPLFDIYLIWSRHLVDRLRSAGARRPFYLPFAHDERLHFPASSQELDPRLAGSVTFAGTYDTERARILAELADLPITIFGGGWDALPRRSPLRPRVALHLALGSNLRRVTTSAAASINILRAQNAGAHNMRTFEIPAMRGVMITARSDEQQELFPEGEASLMYSDVDQLRTCVRRAIQDREEMAEVRRGAVERSSAHTYVERARFVLRELESL